MKRVYIIDGARTAIGKFNGFLAPKSAVDLGITVVSELLKRNEISGEGIDETIFGNVLQAGLGQNVARQIAMGAGIPAEKTSMTINMVCASGLRSVSLAAQAIQCSDADLIIAGGTESMSNAPYLLTRARSGYRLGNGELVDSMVHDGLQDIFGNYHMGITAENIAEQYGISREEQDEFAYNSQNKAEQAMKNERFDDEIIPVAIPQRKAEPIIFTKDEHPRAGITVENLKGLKPAFKRDGTVTAGNAAGINDGAACVLVAGEEAVKKHGFKPIARIISYAYCGVNPDIMGIGPVPAAKAALSKAGWSIDDLELIELNEAFAVQSIAVNREMGWNTDIVNVNGGAIALGHPLGATGSRILVTLLYEVKKRSVKKGLASLCIGGGMGMAMCIEAM